MAGAGAESKIFRISLEHLREGSGGERVASLLCNGRPCGVSCVGDGTLR